MMPKRRIGGGTRFFFAFVFSSLIAKAIGTLLSIQRIISSDPSHANIVGLFILGSLEVNGMGPSA
jgi:hypothetical protein